MFQVVGRQQDLGGVMAKLAERPLVDFDEAALSDGGHGLQMGQIGGPTRQSQPPHARPDGPGADQHHLSPRRQHAVHLIDQLLDALLVEWPVAAGEHARAHLHHDRRGQRGDLLSQQIDHGQPGYRNSVRDRIAASQRAVAINPARSPRYDCHLVSENIAPRAPSFGLLCSPRRTVKWHPLCHPACCGRLWPGGTNRDRSDIDKISKDANLWRCLALQE